MASRHIVVFSGSDLRASTVEAIEALAAALPETKVLVVRNAARSSRGRWLRAKFRRLRREPISYPLELLGQVAGALWPRGRHRPRPGPIGLPDLEAGDVDNV
ncbi:MAG: hypothetical protein KDC98_03740, partial [Planctomycetes bacterium]|nr:hypothetical protein [Planctomycetota bacterium]